jgi:hypothetical protein
MSYELTVFASSATSVVYLNERTPGHVPNNFHISVGRSQLPLFAPGVLPLLHLNHPPVPLHTNNSNTTPILPLPPVAIQEYHLEENTHTLKDSITMDIIQMIPPPIPIPFPSLAKIPTLTKIIPIPMEDQDRHPDLVLCDLQRLLRVFNLNLYQRGGPRSTGLPVGRRVPLVVEVRVGGER